MSYLTCLWLSFAICKVGVIKCLCCRIVVRTKSFSVYFIKCLEQFLTYYTCYISTCYYFICLGDRSWYAVSGASSYKHFFPTSPSILLVVRTSSASLLTWVANSWPFPELTWIMTVLFFSPWDFSRKGIFLSILISISKFKFQFQFQIQFQFQCDSPWNFSSGRK